jgi:DNA-binding ferritin-like protein
MNIASKIKFLMELQAQVKINHWQTKGYARHKAFDELHGGLSDLTDTFAEAAMGKYGRFTLENDDKTLNIVNLTELDLKEMLQTSKEALIQWNNEFDSTDTDIMNIRDEILGLLNKITYLLTLE